MKAKELNRVVKIAIEQLARHGKDAAVVYQAIVELDQQVRTWRSRASDAGYCPSLADLDGEGACADS